MLVADAGTNLKSAVDYMAAIKRPVTVIVGADIAIIPYVTRLDRLGLDLPLEAL